MINVTFFDQHAEITAEAENGAETSRTIRGTAVPWNTVGTVSDGTRVRFRPGSLDAAARPVVTIGHEGPPIGRTTDNTATDTGMATTVRVSRVRDGDEALVLASDGVLGMFSVGVNPIEFAYDADGVMDVIQGEWHHTALLPFGAFASAVVTDVAASAPQGATMTITNEIQDLGTLDAISPPAEVTAGAALPPQQPAVIPVSAARPAAPPLTLQRIATLVAQANRGELTTEAVRSTIQAALTSVTTTNIGAIVAPIYRSEITGIIDHGTPLLNVLGGSPLPGSGMSSSTPSGHQPTTGIQATEKTQIVSTAVAMTLKTAPVITIAGGNDISLQAVERSSPSFLEAYLRAASVDWGRKAEAYVLSILTPLAEVVAPGAGSFLDRVQLLLASLDPAVTPAGPLFIGMSYDVAMPLIGVKVNDGPAFWDGSISFGNMLPTINADGLTMFVDWNLPVKTMIAGSRQAATVHKSAGAPADIRVVDVSLLGLDVGVYGYLAVTVEYPGALSVMTLP